MSELPRISIVTPSFEQGRFIEKTLRSVLDQGYPDVELIVIDGGSTDETLDVLRRYDDRLTYWVSEPDRGQTHAINKGFAHATGQVLGWLNSDDRLAEGSLEIVGRTLADGTGNMALVGHCEIDDIDSGRSTVRVGEYVDEKRLTQFWRGYRMHQPAIFWRREVVDEVGLPDEALHAAMDFEYWLRIAARFEFVNVDEVLASATFHRDAKTGDGFRNYYREARRVARHASGLRPWHPRFWFQEVMMSGFNAYRAVRQPLNRRPVRTK